MGRTVRYLGAAATAACLAVVSPVHVSAARFIDLSPDACRQALQHAAPAGSIEGCSAGVAGMLAFRLLEPGPLPEAPAFAAASTALPAPAALGAGPRSAPVRAAPAAPRGSDVFSTSAILAISDARVYPNPFNPAFTNTTIEFFLSEDARVEITAYDWTGAFVDRIYEGPGVMGVNRPEWGGQTEDGRRLGNGVYLIRIVAVTDARTESQVLKAVVWNDG